MVKRQLPKPAELLELMRFKRHEWDGRKRRLEAALTIADLPPMNTRRWVIRRKAEVVAAARAVAVGSSSASETAAWTMPGRLASSQSFSSGRHSWPTAKGARICRPMSKMDCRWMPPLAPPISRATSSGVTITPSRFDRLALVRAPATLPPAMEVKAMDDCTVDGSRHRYSIPVSRSG